MLPCSCQTLSGASSFVLSFKCVLKLARGSTNSGCNSLKRISVGSTRIEYCKSPFLLQLQFVKRMQFVNSDFETHANSAHHSNLFTRISIVYSANEICLLLIPSFVSLFVKLFSNWLPSIRDNNSHANVRKKSNIANGLTLHCQRLDENFKQRIVCDLRITNDEEMGIMLQKTVKYKKIRAKPNNKINSKVHQP